MRVVALDFETFFSQEYTLNKLSTEAYVRDPRFEVHGAAIKWGPATSAQWYDRERLAFILKEEDWRDVLLVCHHAQFDGLILKHHFGIAPKMWACTLSMARHSLGNHLPVGLDQVRKYFNLPAKSTPYSLFRGKHWSELGSSTRELIAAGACDEVESIWKIFGLLSRDFPKEELTLIDITIRMFTEPVLRADTRLLGELWTAENERKKDYLKELGLTSTDLASNGRFKALLEAEGIEIEHKKGGIRKDGTREQIPAFAKTDQFMRDLLEHPHPRVRSLVEARLGHKSTLLQTRAETLGWMAARGAMPVYLRYCGAHTTRWSGGDGVNWQNFRRGSELRRAILAPEGYLLGVIDLSQIECRVLACVAGQEDELDKFRQGKDPYVEIASLFYGRAITKEDKEERGTGKQAILSCGYGCGAQKFQATAKLGIYGPPVNLSLEDAQRAVKLYRDTHEQVCVYWRQASSIIERMADKKIIPFSWGPIRVEYGRIVLPNGAWLDYSTLRRNPEEPLQWEVRRRFGWTKLYGGKLVENVVQALARVILSQAMLRISAFGYKIATCTHDEVVVLIPNDGYASSHLKICTGLMKQVPAWLSNLPLDAEAHMSERYSK